MFPILFDRIKPAAGEASLTLPSTNLLFGYVADDLNLNNLDLVTDWPTQVGDDIDAQQTVTASKPQFISSYPGLNNRAAVYFDSVDDNMIILNMVNQAQPLTFYAVIDADAAGSLRLFENDSGVRAWRMDRSNFGNNLIGAYSTGSGIIVAFEANGAANSERWEDGVSIVGPGNAGTNGLVSSGTTRMGSTHNAGAGFFSGHIAALACYTETYNASTVSTIADYYGITV